MTGRILFTSFKNWGSKDRVYKRYFKGLSENALGAISDAFTELQVHKPGTWEFWWANEHMRYKGKISNQEMRTVHQLIYVFLTKYNNGKLNDNIGKRKPDRAEKDGKARA